MPYIFTSNIPYTPLNNYTTIYDIQNNYFTNTIDADTLKNIIDNINAIKYAPTEKEISFNNLSQQFDYFIKTEFNTITPANYNVSGDDRVTLLKIAVTTDKIKYSQYIDTPSARRQKNQ